MWLLLPFLGCDRLEAASQVVDGFGDTTVVQAVFLGADVPNGVELPDDSGIYTSFCKVFLAEVSNSSDVADAPLSGAHVSFLGAGSGKIQLDETADGEYRGYSTDGLVYGVDERATVQFTAGGEAGSVGVTTPDAPEFSLPSDATAQEDVTVSLPDSTFANVVAIVYDLDHSVQTWDNVPEDVEEAGNLSADGPPTTELVIPGEAFIRGSTYVIGVAGLAVSAPEDIEGANRALSTFAAGRLGLGLLSVSGRRP